MVKKIISQSICSIEHNSQREELEIYILFFDSNYCLKFNEIEYRIISISEKPDSITIKSFCKSKNVKINAMKEDFENSIYYIVFNDTTILKVFQWLHSLQEWSLAFEILQEENDKDYYAKNLEYFNSEWMENSKIKITIEGIHYEYQLIP